MSTIDARSYRHLLPATLLICFSFILFGTLSFADNSFFAENAGSDQVDIIKPSNEIVLSEKYSDEDIKILDVYNDVDDTENTDESVELKRLQQEFLERLKSDLNLARADYQHYKSTVVDNNQYLERLQTEHSTLTSQVAGLDFEQKNTKKRLEDAYDNLHSNEVSIIGIYDQIKIREVALAEQKLMLKKYFRLMYTEEDRFLSFNNGEVDAFKLLLADDSANTNMQSADYVAILNDSALQLVDKLNSLNDELIKYNDQLKSDNKSIVALKQKIEKENEELVLQKIAKEKLLKITSGQQIIYKKLLEDSMLQEKELRNEVVGLGSAVAFVESKIKIDGDVFNPADFEHLLTEKSDFLFQFNQSSLGGNISKIAWPAAPSRGISAYFRDPSYVGVFGVRHNAIDIPIYQGSALHSAADGVVYKTADNGLGYSYVIVAHSGGLMSVYGHVSDILVTEGQLVSQGSIIAMSGGMPGTKGAGYMTTGPHLHFEMLLNGKHVDPLTYLPLSTLSEDTINTLPEKYHSAWLSSVMKTTSVQIAR